jgi:NTP pyrophosphatase (non-canonical NTP hydrolase)
MQNKEKEILSITQEECAEVVQAISKVNRFGIDAMHNGASNRDRLTEETGDLFCMIELMIESGLIDRNEMLNAAQMKRKKLIQWSNIFDETEVVENV